MSYSVAGIWVFLDRDHSRLRFLSSSMSTGQLMNPQTLGIKRREIKTKSTAIEQLASQCGIKDLGRASA